MAFAAIAYIAAHLRDRLSQPYGHILILAKQMQGQTQRRLLANPGKFGEMSHGIVE